IYPSLPSGSSYISASMLGNSVFVYGGKIQLDRIEKITNNFLELDLSDEISPEWKEHEPCPGGARFGASLVKQSNGDYDCLYLFGGKSDQGYLSDAYIFDPRR